MEFFEDIVAVRLNGCYGNEQEISDFPIGLSRRQNSKDLFLAQAQQVIAVLDTAPLSFHHILLYQQFLNTRTEVCFSGPQRLEPLLKRQLRGKPSAGILARLPLVPVERTLRRNACSA